jgi:hypothetical protein
LVDGEEGIGDVHVKVAGYTETQFGHTNARMPLRSIHSVASGVATFTDKAAFALDALRSTDFACVNDVSVGEAD